MKIIYFTNSFPAGKAVNWKLFELQVFEKCVDSILVVPFTDNQDTNEHVQLPTSIQVTRPLLHDFKGRRLRSMLASILFSRQAAFFIAEFFRFKVFASKPRFIDWLVDSYQLWVALNSPVFNDLLRQYSKDTVWYFYWGRNPASLIPFIKKRISAHIVCRFHGYDLYKERNHGYIPYQEEIIANTDLLLPCSSDGRSYLYNNFNLSPGQVFVARLGTRFQGTANLGTGKCLTIVSCSFCVPVKRLHLIFDALEKLTISFRWTHIGDGPLFQEYRERASHFTQPDRQICFHGYLPSESVIPFYLNGLFDIFINVSESEGVPVSIMEALSVGLPILATNVGGTGEIVDEEVGFLVDKNITAVELAALLEEFAKLPIQKIQKFREATVNRFRTLCDSDSNALQLINKIQETFQE